MPAGRVVPLGRAVLVGPVLVVQAEQAVLAARAQGHAAPGVPRPGLRLRRVRLRLPPLQLFISKAHTVAVLAASGCKGAKPYYSEHGIMISRWMVYPSVREQ